MKKKRGEEKKKRKKKKKKRKGMEYYGLVWKLWFCMDFGNFCMDISLFHF